MRIATDVGRDWRMLSRYLGLDDTTITSIQLQSQGDLAEASLQSLLRCVCVCVCWTIDHNYELK